MTLLIPLPGNDAMTARLAELNHYEVGALGVHTFPDGETRLRFLADVSGRDIVLICSLEHPNEKFLPLAFAAATARDLGARRIGLVAPYLCYMRQDKRFHTGEAVTSQIFADLISRSFDWMMTVDPHLHRTKSLGEIYSIATRVLHAGPVLAGWIRDNVATPVLIGPDEESRQWTEAVATRCGAPFAIFQKQRLGDRDVRTIPPQFLLPKGATPIVLDDIISSGTTMLETLRLLTPMTPQPPIAMAIHGVFAEHARAAIMGTGARLVTSNSVPGAGGVIDLSPLIAQSLKEMDRPLGEMGRV